MDKKKEEKKEIAKAAAARYALQYVKDGMRVGLGTGTTAYYFITYLGKLVQQGLRVEAVASSKASEKLAHANNIPLLDDTQFDYLDIVVDGADEVDHQKRLIKGGGGALFREKLCATFAKETIILVDSSKVVETLGHFPLPIEVSLFALQAIAKELLQRGYNGNIRNKDGKLFLTDGGNAIIDLKPQRIENPEEFHTILKGITGVIETGLFINLADRVLVGDENGNVEEF